MNTFDHEHEFVRKHLAAALPPSRNLELQTDLWPRMLRRLEEPRPHFGWFEALLAASIAAVLVAFPELIPMVFYHL